MEFITKDCFGIEFHSIPPDFSLGVCNCHCVVISSVFSRLSIDRGGELGVSHCSTGLAASAWSKIEKHFDLVLTIKCKHSIVFIMQVFKSISCCSAMHSSVPRASYNQIIPSSTFQYHFIENINITSVSLSTSVLVSIAHHS